LLGTRRRHTGSRVQRIENVVQKPPLSSFR